MTIHTSRIGNALTISGDLYADYVCNRELSAFFRSAAVYHNDGDVYQVSTEALSIDPESVEMWINLGLCYLANTPLHYKTSQLAIILEDDPRYIHKFSTFEEHYMARSVPPSSSLASSLHPSQTTMAYKDEYEDEREKLPMRLMRSYAGYNVSISEHRDADDESTGMFNWEISKPGPRIEMSIHAKGLAPTLDMAYQIIEKVLDTYAIRIRSGETKTVSVCALL